MRESIFFASIRAFFVTLFGVGGFLIGLLLILALFGAFSVSTEGTPEISHSFDPTIVANGNGEREVLSNDVPVILKLNIDGAIGLEGVKSKNVAKQLIESRERALKNRVKAILLYVNSPGGTVTDSDNIYRLLKAYKEKYKTPIYAYTDGVCASGGMYIAASADKILSAPSSLIGSVGVLISPALNFSQLMEKVGVQSLTIYDGKGKDNLNPLRPWHKGEEENLKQAVDYYYDRFVNIMVESRPQLTRAKLVEEYGANVYPAEIAQNFGFIDESNSSLEEAIKKLAEASGINDNSYQVVELKSSNWIAELFQSNFGLLRGQVTHRFDVSVESQPELQNRPLYLYRS